MHTMADYKKLRSSVLLGGLTCLFLTACFQNNGRSTSTSSATTTSSAPTLPNGPRTAKIIFKTITNGGSFSSTLPTNGTTAAYGSGHAATTLFNADNSTLSTSPSATTWPKWISSVEIGISGSSNANATSPNCARFAAAGEDSTARCKFKYPTDTTTDYNCGAPASYYRVSDFDCYNVTNTTGIGSDGRGLGSGLDTDGVYIRIVFNRDTTVLGAYENVLAVLEYSASGLTPAPTNPSTCMSSGAAAFDQCADFTWNIFTKHYASEALQPFLLLAPPTLAAVNTTLGTGGTGITSTKQFVVPLAGDSSITILQLSRTGFSKTLGPNGTTANPDPTFQNICAPSGTGAAANSAFCVGTVFYSLTLYRI